VNLGKNASDTCSLLSKAYGGEATKKSFLSGINSFKTACISKLQMKSMLITFFNIRILFTLNSFHKAKQLTSLLCGNTEAVT
jgi:hypothetical protein